MNVFPPAGSPRRRQLVRLGGLLLVLIAVLWFRFGRTAAPTAGQSSPESPDAPVAVATLPQPVRLDDLDTVPVLADASRNPFAYGARSAAPIATAPLPGSAYTPAPAAPAAPQGPPPIQLRLTGMAVLPGSDRSLVTLTDPTTKGLYQGFEGDIVDGRYRIVKVGVQSVVVSYVDGTGARTLSLGG